MTPTTATVYERIMPLLLGINDAGRAASSHYCDTRVHRERFGDAARPDWSLDSAVLVTDAENDALHAAYWAIVGLMEGRS